MAVVRVFFLFACFLISAAIPIPLDLMIIFFYFLVKIHLSFNLNSCISCEVWSSCCYCPLEITRRNIFWEGKLHTKCYSWYKGHWESGTLGLWNCIRSILYSLLLLTFHLEEFKNYFLDWGILNKLLTTWQETISNM